MAYCLSGDRWHKPSPPSPATDAAHRTIKQEMGGRRITVFHATRLLDWNAVRRDGLVPLDLARQISAMKEGLVASRQFHAETDAAPSVT